MSGQFPLNMWCQWVSLTAEQDTFIHSNNPSQLLLVELCFTLIINQYFDHGVLIMAAMSKQHFLSLWFDSFDYVSMQKMIIITN